MPDRPTLVRGALAVLAVGALSLLFIASYAGALHEPRPHAIPIAVTAQVPAKVAARIDASEAFAVDRVADARAAQRRIDRREDYGAVIADARGLHVVVAPAASPAVAQVLQTSLVSGLRGGGAPVALAVVHPLPPADGRGLVGFYLAVGWVVAGYLGATLFGIAFGTAPGRRRVAQRLAGLLALGLLVGIAGAAVAGAIASYDRGFATIALLGVLTVLAVGAATMAFQSLLGLAGTALAILLFVVLGNPSGGGPYATELLPGLWRAVGPLLPPGAATTGVRDAAYFPAAPVAGPLLVLWVWFLAGAAIALAIGGRGRELPPDEAMALAGTAAA